MWGRIENKPELGFHYVQHVQVFRNGERRHFEEDLGPMVGHPHWQPFNFPAVEEYSVGEAREIAEELRLSKDPQQHEPINIAESYLNLLEERHKRKVHASEFGRYLIHVR